MSFVAVSVTTAIGLEFPVLVARLWRAGQQDTLTSEAQTAVTRVFAASG